MNGTQKDKRTRPERESVEDIFSAVERRRMEHSQGTETRPEQIKELGSEARPEQEATIPQEREQPMAYPAPGQSASPIPPQPVSPLVHDVEAILSENLQEMFLQMTPQEQMQFKRVGEQAASKIAQLLQEAKVRVKEILNLIKDWLRLIPSVNRFFLEQEAKIKTDRLLRLRRRGE